MKNINPDLNTYRDKMKTKMYIKIDEPFPLKNYLFNLIVYGTQWRILYDLKNELKHLIQKGG